MKKLKPNQFFSDLQIIPFFHARKNCSLYILKKKNTSQNKNELRKIAYYHQRKRTDNGG